MSFIEKIKESFATQVANILVLPAIAIIIWIFYTVFPYIEGIFSKLILFQIAMASVVLNIILLFTRKKKKLKLKYGIYWDSDKNPHCPSCKIPIGAYDDYEPHGEGYPCNSCNQIFPLTNAEGSHIKPEQALEEL